MDKPLTNAINALTTYANEITGVDDPDLSSAVRTLCDGYGSGGEDKWVRPAEWANFDLLSPDDHAVYFTMDNRAAPTELSVHCTGYPVLERVSIATDGTVTVLGTAYTATVNEPDITIYIPASAGDYPVYRLHAGDGKSITYFGFCGNYDWLKVLEMWFNLPQCTNFSIGYSYRDTLNRNMVAMTFAGFPQNHRDMSLSGKMESLRCLRNLCDYPLYISNHMYNYCLQFIEGDIRLKTGNMANIFRECRLLKSMDLSNAVANQSWKSFTSAFLNCYSIKSIILPSVDYSAVTSFDSAFSHCTVLEEFTFPEGDYSAVTNINNMFNSDYNLRSPIILPKTLSCTIGTGVFADCRQLPCVVILSETMLPLSSTGSFQNLYTHGRNFHLYVRQSLIEEYQQATNWSNIYAANPNFFQPIEGSEFEYLLEGE